MWRRVALARTEISEERIASIIRMERISAQVTATVVPSSLILSTLMMEAMFFRNVGSCESHTASHPRRRHSSRFWLVYERVTPRCKVALTESRYEISPYELFPGRKLIIRAVTASDVVMSLVVSCWGGSGLVENPWTAGLTLNQWSMDLDAVHMFVTRWHTHTVIAARSVGELMTYGCNWWLKISGVDLWHQTGDRNRRKERTVITEGERCWDVYYWIETQGVAVLVWKYRKNRRT
jgi:hypothetical protein